MCRSGMKDSFHVMSGPVRTGLLAESMNAIASRHRDSTHAKAAFLSVVALTFIPAL